MTEIIITLQQHNNNTITIIVYHISSFWITMLYFNVVHEQDDIQICWLVGSPGLAFHVGIHQHKSLENTVAYILYFIFRKVFNAFFTKINTNKYLSLGSCRVGLLSPLCLPPSPPRQRMVATVPVWPPCLAPCCPPAPGRGCPWCAWPPSAAPSPWRWPAWDSPGSSGCSF